MKKIFSLRTLLILILCVVGNILIIAGESFAYSWVGDGWLLSWEFEDETGMKWYYNEVRSQTGTLISWGSGQKDGDGNTIWKEEGGNCPCWHGKYGLTEKSIKNDALLYYHKGKIYFSDKSSNVQLSLFEISGQLIYNGIIESSDGLNLNIPTGLYIAVVESENQFYSFKIKVGE